MSEPRAVTQSVQRRAPLPSDVPQQQRDSSIGDARSSQAESRLRVLVLSSVYPNEQQPLLGLFVEARATRLAQHCDVVVVSPTPWFPFQALLRRWRPGFRPSPARREMRNGLMILHPRFISVPGVLKALDGVMMALCSLPTVLRLRRETGVDVIDSHFAYPEGFAASLLARWLRLPFTITLRGTIVPLSKTWIRRRLIQHALIRAQRVIAVCDALRQVAIGLGTDAGKTLVIANGVDAALFSPVPRVAARDALGLPHDARVLVTIGGLVERKGFHRVIATLPSLRKQFPNLCYLVVGGASVEGDLRQQLLQQTQVLGLELVVRFLGPLPPERLPMVLSAADAFVLATRNEGWANVLLEAMACGVPVVTTDVGGNAEVVCRPDLGTLVPFGDAAALENAIADALHRTWDREAIISFARANSWNGRIALLANELAGICRPEAATSLS